MVNKVYLFAAILALAHFTFILAGSGMTKQPQKRLVGFVEAPPTKNKPYLHEALYSFNRFG